MIREQFPATAIILASDDRLVTPPDALSAAVVDYIVPPVSSERLLTIVRTGIAWSLDKTRVH
jgi:response regulator of citrate/malate metabolism